MNNNTSYQNSQSGQKLIEQRETIDINFGKFISKWRRHWKPALGIFLVTSLLTGAATTLLKKTYQAEGKLRFKIDRTASNIGLQKDGSDGGDLKPLLADQTPLSTEIEVIASNPLLETTIDRLKLTNDRGEALKPKQLKDNLNLKIASGSDVVQISYKDKNARVASDVVNTLMKVYIEDQINDKQSDTKNARDIIAKGLPQVEDKLLKAEQDLKDFKLQNNVLALDKEAESAVTQLADLNRQITTTEAQLRGVEAQVSALQSQLGLNLNQALAANKLGDSPVIQGIQDELKAVEVELANQRQIYQDTHPNIINLEEKKAALNRNLEREMQRVTGGLVDQGLLKVRETKDNQLERFITLDIQRLDLSRQLNSMYQARANYQKRANLIPELEKKQEALIRQINSTKTTYTTLLDSLETTLVKGDVRTGNAKIIELAKTPDKGRSGKLPLLALGTILGVLLAQLAVLLLDKVDKSLKTITEIKEIFAYKILGIIPLHPNNDTDEPELGKKPVMVLQEPESFISEIYRMVQVNLKLLNIDHQRKVILVTSSVPGEGKTTVSANLAATLAQTKRKVLLIDGDLRNPSQSPLWGVNNKVGLSEILSGEARLEEALTHPIHNLDFLPTGQARSNPLSLLDSEEMTSLIDRAKQEYDVVIIDAPPLLVAADVLTLGKMTEGILLVSRLGVVEQESAQAARDTLEGSGQKVLGLVVNGVNQEEFDRFFYYAKKYYSTSNYGAYSGATSVTNN